MNIPDNKDITYLARTHFRNQDQVFGIKRKDRRQHMYVLGKSGTGKSALLYNMIIQNIKNGEGVCVVDPHGELVEDVLRAIPEERLSDVIYFNPADTDYHIGFNVLEVADPKYKHLVASGLMGIFTKIWANTWSARMEYILNNSILALLDTPGTTLLGIPRLLVDKEYRQTIVGNLKDPVVKAFWIHEYEAWQDKFRNEAIAPIQNKVGQFLSTSIVRNVVGQSASTIDIFKIMNEEKIFLVNVSKGRVGEDNSALLGAMLITKIQLAAMERVRIPENERKDFYLYVDEFQNFVTDSFASILSEARKYRLNLIIAHQYIGQLMTETGPAVRDAVFGNVGTMIVFRVGAEDAEFIEKEFEPEFTVEDIVGQPNYHVYLKLMVDGVTSRPFSAFTLPPMHIHAAADSKERVIDMSRRLYTRSREDIEREINDWSGVDAREKAAMVGKWKAICSTCGKEVLVPFEPEPGRPIYCKDCMAKIKEGTLKPVQTIKLPKPAPEPVAEAPKDPLSSLGIRLPPVSNGAAGMHVHKPVEKTPPSAPLTSPDPVPPPTTPRVVSPTTPPSPSPRQPASQASHSPIRTPYKHPPRPHTDKADLGKLLAEAIANAGTATREHGHDESLALAKEMAPASGGETVSLSSLKKNTSSPFSKKEQTESNKDELRRALEHANVTPTASPSVVHPHKEEASSPSAPVPPSKKKKEVPEDLLRKVLE